VLQRWLLLLGLVGLLGLVRGLLDARAVSMHWFDGYADAANSLRVFKSLGFALLLSPLLQHDLQHDAARAARWLAAGMVAGLGVVACTALWERAVFPGVFDFSTHYRSVALFWEMHVGGAALDAYLALAAPFAVWALRQARRPVAWLAGAGLLLVVVYAALTTFSRGVYLAVAAPMLLLEGLLWRQRQQAKAGVLPTRVPLCGKLAGWRAKAAALLLLALLAEVAAVLGGGSFMAERLADTGPDLGRRLRHWQNGAGLLERPVDAWLGLGLGRLPANYAQRVPGGEFSGQVRWRSEPAAGLAANGFAVLAGPKTLKRLAGSFELTQRVSRLAAGQQQVRLQAWVVQPTLLELYLCERHLLYDGGCQTALVKFRPVLVDGLAAWQSREVTLQGPPVGAGIGLLPLPLMFSIGVRTVAAEVALDNLQLAGSSGVTVLENGDFSAGLAHWLGAAQTHFLPWHLDNLYLELWVERGWVGLLLMLAALLLVLRALLVGPASRLPLSPYLAAALTGALLIGLVSSIMDVPRVAFLLCLLTLFGIQLALQDARCAQ